MPRVKKQLPVLTATELRMMNALWENGPGTVNDVLSVLPKGELAYTSVLTMLRVLEQKGYVKHKATTTRAFVYHPTVPRKDAVANALSQFLHRFFNGSAASLTANLLETQHLDRDELVQMRKLIAKEPADD